LNTRLELSNPGWGPVTFSPKASKVRTEISLSALAYNLKRMIAMMGVKPMIAAIKA